jgi:FkbM family methyltransferase
MTAQPNFDGINETHSYPSYSQSGEDRIAYYYFGDKIINYVDIGSSSPCGHNNTYLFYTLGGRGLLVEAEEAYFPSYQKIRPRDIHLFSAVVPSILNLGQIEFYRSSDRGWSTVSQEHFEIAKEVGKADSSSSSVLVPTTTINDVLSRALTNLGRIDLLSVDIEGMDWSVIQELGEERPEMVIIESSKVDTSLRGYTLYASTPSNKIFLRIKEL